MTKHGNEIKVGDVLMLAEGDTTTVRSVERGGIVDGAVLVKHDHGSDYVGLTQLVEVAG